MVVPGPPPLTWHEDPARGGWTGVDHAGVEQGRITVQADGKRPLLARSRSGWRLTYKADELDRARAALDHVWAKVAPPPVDDDRDRRRRQERGPRKVPNEPGEAPPHPGVLRHRPS